MRHARTLGDQRGIKVPDLPYGTNHSCTARKDKPRGCPHKALPIIWRRGERAKA